MKGYTKKSYTYFVGSEMIQPGK